MTDLGWRADGIERARAAGGIELELYRRPGFTGGKAVRRSTEGGAGAGFAYDNGAEYIDDDPEPDAHRCR
jgi:hypothetical protein